MILVACLILGVLLRLASGNRIEDLSRVHLRGELWLLVLLCVQAVLPLLRTTGPPARLAFALWLATFPVLTWTAWRNRAQPGMLVVALGLLLNFVVVSSNGGMPVVPAAAVAAGLHGQLSIPIGDFVHVLGTTSTRLPWLADVLPLPWAPLVRIVPSAGDVLLYVGVVAFISDARVGCAESLGEREGTVSRLRPSAEGTAAGASRTASLVLESWGARLHKGVQADTPELACASSCTGPRSRP